MAKWVVLFPFRMQRPFFIFVIASLLLFQLALSRPTANASKSQSHKSKAHGSVFARKLVSEKTSYLSILRNAQNAGPDSSHSVYSGEKLGFITPWNGNGKVFAKKYAAKFTYISPCWFHLDEGGVLVNGRHNIDLEWMEAVKAQGETLILPRITFETWKAPQFQVLLDSEKRAKLMADIVDIVADFDGVVFDTIYTGLSVNKGTSLFMFVADLRKAMGAEKKIVIVLPAYNGILEHPALKRIVSDFADRFTINSYDYPAGNSGPNAPIWWQRDLQSALVKYGYPMNKAFYGWKYENGERAAVSGNDYLQLLERKKPSIRFVAHHQEHVAMFGRNEIWYPTLFSLQKRFELTHEFGCAGISIWELGQGLEYFYDLL